LEQYRYWRQPHHRWHRFNGPYYLPTPIEKSEEYFKSLETKIRNSSFESPRSKVVIADRESNEFLGLVNSYWESKETHWLCIGIGIYDDAQWGKGLGEEALSLWVAYLFEAHPEIVRLDLRTWSGNRGMMRLAEKLGFVLEATFRRARIVDGHYYDGLGYGILREEWFKKGSGVGAP
jgi:putative hydrolase of HD superfamily